MKRHVCLFAVTSTFLLTSFFSYSQIPPNDNPAAAIGLTVGSSSCTSQTEGTTVDATNSGEGGTPDCGSDLTSDVWYTAEVPTSGNLTIETFNVGATSFDSVLTVYSGTLGSLTQVACDDQGGSSGNLSKVLLTGQSSGTTLYIRVWGYAGEQKPFEICAWEHTPPPNDNPAAAIGLTVGSDSCSSKTEGTMTWASNSGEGGTPNCGSSTLTSDLWYTAEVPASGNLAIETFNVGATDFDSVLTVYSGTLGSLTEVACDDDGGSSGSLSKVVFTNQFAATTLYIRVWGYSGDRKPFEICAWEHTPVPNDNPAAAIPLTVGSGSCTSKTEGTMTWASNSGEGGTPNCGLDLSSDVWYTAEVPASGNLAIETFNVGATDFDSVLTVYSGTPGGDLTQVACNDDGGSGSLSKVVFTNQSATAILYIRVWGFVGDRKPFEICAWDDAPLSTEDALASFLKVYPNPSTTTLFIDSPVPLEKATVYTLTGTRVLTVLLSQTKPKLDVSELAAGVYVLEIANAKGNHYMKFIKK